MRRLLPAAVAALLLSLPPLAAAAVLAEAGDLVIADGAAHAAGPAARTGAGYFTVRNTGSDDDRLVAAESDAADRVELHGTDVRDGIARMVPLAEGVPVPAGASVTFAQGGLHLMFLGLTGPWEPGAGVTITLVFERAGPVEVVLPVAAGPAGTHGHGQGGHEQGGHDEQGGHGQGEHSGSHGH